MKRVLLDTHVLLWWLNGGPHLGKIAISIISDPDNDVFVSAATTWEIAIKKNKGLLVALDNIDSIAEQEGFTKLPISLHHGEATGSLPMHHRDPFDRMLIAQSQAEGLQLMTADIEFVRYGINLLRALE
jgi:PIN domain nuclease of toxin-antitoxin system